MTARDVELEELELYEVYIELRKAIRATQQEKSRVPDAELGDIYNAADEARKHEHAHTL